MLFAGRKDYSMIRQSIEEGADWVGFSRCSSCQLPWHILFSTNSHSPEHRLSQCMLCDPILCSRT